jgi:predicted pyridoxine 5'-phosphate oxidase superfamily flavin-nucleotide-binding protein
VSEPAESKFHAGEQAIQSRVGARELIEPIGQRIIRDFMPGQHREFFAMLPFVVVAAQHESDGALHPHAAMLVGRPGFAHSPDPETLRIEALPDEPLRRSLVPGAKVALLGIQLETRRRNRLNGTIAQVDGAGFSIRVEQSFGNCPQYIQAREHRFVDGAPAPAGDARALGDALLGEAAALVGRADTFFIASAARAIAVAEDPRDGLDVSHRGGKPGFVRIHEQDPAVLLWPDFRGNFFFNTLGNLAQNPRCGLYFVDFATGDALSLVGDAEILWRAPDGLSYAGAQRYVRFRLRAGRFARAAVPLRWSAPQEARELADTGGWRAVATLAIDSPGGGSLPRWRRHTLSIDSSSQARNPAAAVASLAVAGAKLPSP